MDVKSGKQDFHSAESSTKLLVDESKIESHHVTATFNLSGLENIIQKKW